MCEAAQTRGGRAQVDNVVVKTWGERREEDGLRNHVDLVLLLDLVDLEAGTAVAGARMHAAVFARAPAWPLRPAGGAVLCRAAKRRAAGAWCPACSQQQHAPPRAGTERRNAGAPCSATHRVLPFATPLHALQTCCCWLRAGHPSHPLPGALSAQAAHPDGHAAASARPSHASDPVQQRAYLNLP